jgi:hypothetical protein
MFRILISMGIAICSAGWLVPLYFAVHCYLHLFQEVSDSQIRGLVEMNSFPFQSTMEDCFFISAVWVGVVILAWSFVGALRLLRPGRTKEKAP